MLITTTTAATPQEHFFARFLTCATISLLLLTSATWLVHLPPWVSMAGGVGPLVYYHLGYLAPRAKTGLSPTAIDSVYYFGFLVTVAALGVSAVSIAQAAGNIQLNTIAFQFGLGLLATGYAVFARIHLSSIAMWVDEASPEAVLDRYVQRSRELVTNVEMASSQFVQLANSLMTKSQEVADTARDHTEKSMLQVARVFDEQLRGTLASANAGLAEIRGLMNETSFVHEREELAKSVRLTLDNVIALNKALSDFAARSNEGARSTQEATSTAEALNHTLVTFDTHLSRVAAPDGRMAAAAKALDEAQALVARSTLVLGASVDELTQMTGTVSGIGKTYKRIETLTTKASAQMETLAQTSERLDDASKAISRSALATQSLATGLERAAAGMPPLAERAEGLERQLASLGTVVGAVEQQLHTLPRPTEEAVALSGELNAALASVQQTLHAASEQALALASHSAAHAQSLEQASAFTRDVASLHATTQSLDATLGKLSTTVARLQQDLATSGPTLGTALTAAESDVRRSSDAARLFNDRLSDVVQVMIDRTKEVRAS